MPMIGRPDLHPEVCGSHGSSGVPDHFGARFSQPSGVATKVARRNEAFSEAVRENERLVRLLGGPALAAGAAVTEELRASR
jgi:hypothetical protein